MVSLNNNVDLLNNIQNVVPECEILQDLSDWKINSDIILSILHINIRSLKLNWDLLCLKINHLLSNLDLLILTEVNVKEEEALSYQLRNFTQTSKCRIHRNGGGVMVFYKNNIQIDNFNYTLDEAENITFKLTHLESKVQLIVLAIYRPPKQNKNRFIDDLNFWLQNAFKKDESIIIVGDINICILKKSKNHCL